MLYDYDSGEPGAEVEVDAPTGQWPPPRGLKGIERSGGRRRALVGVPRRLSKYFQHLFKASRFKTNRPKLRVLKADPRQGTPRGHTSNRLKRAVAWYRCL